MTLLETGMYSNTLRKMTHVNILYPDRGEKKEDIKVLYLLHGYGDDCTSWLRRTSIERYSEKYGIALVMPDAHQSFYANVSLGNYYDYMAKELPREMERIFSFADSASNRYIAGLSMGGYGAVKIALRECGRYAAAASLSGCLNIKGRELGNLVFDLFGGELPDKDDLFCLASKAVMRPDKPKIYMGVGYDDFLYAETDAFKKHLDTIGYEYTYRESEGNHCWDFWDEYIQYVLEWMFAKK